MTTMPNARIAQVPEGKILSYLLNVAHPDGAGKASFFLAMGYRRTHWRVFLNDLEGVAQTGVLRAVVTTVDGG